MRAKEHWNLKGVSPAEAQIAPGSGERLARKAHTASHSSFQAPVHARCVVCCVPAEVSGVALVQLLAAEAVSCVSSLLQAVGVCVDGGRDTLVRFRKLETWTLA